MQPSEDTDRQAKSSLCKKLQEDRRIIGQLSPLLVRLTHCLSVSPAGSKLFDPPIVFLKEFFKKVNFEEKNSRGQEGKISQCAKN